MTLPVYIARRHLLARLRSSLLTAAGVAVGVMVMSVMSSLMLGLQLQFIDNVVEATPNVTIEGVPLEARRETAVPAPPGGIVSLSRRRPPEAEETIRNYRQLLPEIERVPGVTATAPALDGQALLRYGTRTEPVQLTGIDPARQARAVAWDANLRNVRGTLETTPNGAIIGIELAKNLGLPADARATLVTAPETQQRVRVIAFYQSGIRPVDETVVYVNLRLAQTLLDVPSGVNSIAVRVRDANRAPVVAARIEAATGLRALSWQETNAIFFSVFTLQRVMTGILIAFVVVIAGFGITNGLITLILEKQRDIGILKALGTTTTRIAVTFLLEGAVMGMAGAVIGIGLAAIGIDYLSRLPLSGEGELTTAQTFTMLRGPAVYLIPAVVAVLVSILASLLPVRQAARYDPVEIIRSAK